MSIFQVSRVTGNIPDQAVTSLLKLPEIFRDNFYANGVRGRTRTVEPTP